MENFLRDGVDMQVLSSGTIAGEAHFFDDATTPSKVRSYLDSSKEADKLKGMKQLLAMLSKGRDIPEFFADVVKNVVVKSIEVKKMVYIYLVHYADFDANCREIALLSINSFQKDMNGPNQLIRGLALRVMTSIRVPDIIQIQLLAVRKCSGDSSPYVRKCAANALVKIYLLDKEQLESLKQILSSLLKDSSTMVLGSAVAAFNEICPTAYDVLHRNYRKLCHLLADMDEWTQISVLEVMTRYVRNQFTDPAPDVAAVVKLQAKQRSSAAVKGRTTTVVRRVVKKAFYSDEEDESEEETVEVKAEVDHQAVLENAINHDSADNLDPDHRLILKSSLPLLKSRNSGVVLGVCSLHYYCGSQSTTTTAAVAKALVRILRNRREVQYVVLNSISTMARERPLMFRPYLTDFLVKSSDPHFNKMLKLEILASICYKDNITPILREMETYVKDSNQKFVAAAVKAIGRIADCDPKVSDSCIEGVMHLLLCSKKSEIVTSACVVVLRQLLQQNTTSAASHKVLHQLVKLLIIEDGIEEPVARSSIVWLVGEFHSVLVNVAPDILRILASGFIDESTETKTQILNLAIKLSLQLPEDENVQSLMTYVLEMSRYDLDTDLRDRSRFMTALMGLAPSNEEGDAPPIDEDALAEFAEHAGAIMLAPKLPPITLIDTAADDGALSFTVGSMSALVGHYLQGYEPLSAWPAVQPNADVRDALKYAEQDAKEAATAGGGGTHSGSRKGRKGGDDSSSEEEDLMAVFSKKKGKKDDSSSSSSSSSGSESESGSGSGSESEEEDSGEESSDSESSEEEKAKNNKKKAAPKAAATGSGKASTAKAPASGGKGKTANLLGGSDSESGKSESSSSGKEESSESESEEDEKPAARVPLAAQKVQPTAKPSPAASGAVPVVAAAATKPAGVTRVGMRKVAPGKKKDPFGGSAEPLAATLVDYGESHETLLAPAAATRPAASQPAVTVSDVEDELDDFLLDVPTEKKQTKTSSTSAAAAGGHDDLLVGGSACMQTSNVMSSAFNAPSANDLVDKFAGMDFTSGGSGVGSAPSSGKLSHDAILSSFNNPTTGGGAGAASPSTAAVMGGGVVMSGGIQLTRPPEASAASLGVPVGSINFEDLAEPKVLLKPELGGGLTVSLVIRNNVTSVAYVGAVSAYLLVKNVNKDRTLRRVRVNFPTDMRKTTVPEIPVMNPMQEVQFPMELVLSGITGKQVKVDIRCDQGAYVGLLVINDWDLLLPFTTTSSEFEVQRKRLGGFNEIVKAYPTSAFQFSNEDIADNELELISRVKKVVNVYLVQGAGVGELMFAGTVRKALVEEKVFITILAAADQVTFKFNSEDPLLSTGLNEAFKKLMPKLPAASCISL